MTKINFTKAVLVWAGGYDRRTAEKCTSSEVFKMCVAGTLVFIPALLGFFSYGYAFFIIGKGATEAALIGGSVAAVVLFLLDRALLALSKPGVISAGMILRVLLAVTVSVLLAEPVLLWAFDDAIAEQQTTELDTAKREARKPFDAEISAIRAEVDPYDQRLQQLQTAYTVEMDGTGGSGEKFKGPIYRQKHADFRTFKKERDAKAKDIDTRVAKAEQEREVLVADVVATNANGILGRMRALGALEQADNRVWWAAWLLRAGLVLVELLPLGMKLSRSGGTNLYHDLADIFDRDTKQAEEAQSKERIALLVKEGELKYQTEFARTCTKQLAMFMNAKTNDANFMMSRVMAMAATKLDHKQRAAERFANESDLLEQIYKDIDAVYDKFLLSVQDMLRHPGQGYSPGNN